MKSDRRDPEPDPGQADRRGAVRGAQAEPRRGVQEDRRPGHDPRLPQGQGAAAGHRPARSAAASCSRRPSTRPCRGFYGEAVEEQRRQGRSASPRSTSPSSRTAQHLTLHRRGRRPAGVRPAGLRRPRGHRRRRRGHRRRRRRAGRRPARALRHAHRRRPRRRRRRLRLHRPRPPPSTARPSTDADRQGPVATRSARATLLDGLDEAVTGLSAGESADFTDHAGRRRPRRPGGRRSPSR